jgi:tRNA(fMet)-specific endonuclease VapC
MQRVNAVNFEEIAVTVITVEEQMRGWLNNIKQAADADRLVSAYKWLRETVEDFNSVKLLDFNQDALAYYTELRRQKIRIGTQDLRIASIVLSVNGILVTRNRRDFSQVPNLMLEDWTIP